MLLPAIVERIGTLSGVSTVLDLFSGTARVGHALKRAGYRVTANDHNAYAATLARCYVAADAETVSAEATRVLRHLAELPPRPGYFTEVFCERARYFQPKNGARIDAIRDEIERLGLDDDVEAVVLVSLMEAADRVDSTCGVQMAYLKKWAPRAHNDLELRLPDLLAGAGQAWQLDAVDAASREEFDLVYLDPPYNQHKYLNNYHVWETLVRWDAPEVYGAACKRIDCQDYQSDFNSKRRISDGLRRVLGAIRAKHLLVSFNSEGYLSEEELLAQLSEVGDVDLTSYDFKRYVGAQIGIYNPRGERVGRVSHLRNQEHLFLVSRHPSP